jgi:hypothetical protein
MYTLFSDLFGKKGIHFKRTPIAYAVFCVSQTFSVGPESFHTGFDED